MMASQLNVTLPLWNEDRNEILPMYAIPWNARFFASVVAGIVSVLIVLANIVAITVYTRVDELKQISSCSLYLSLAVADLLVGFTGFLYIHPPILGYWPYPMEFCQIAGYLTCCLMCVSLCSLGCLSYDRYSAICRPFQHESHVTSKRCLIAVVLTWIYVFSVFSLLFALPYQAYGFQENINLCLLNFVEARMIPVVLLMIFIVPMPGMVLMVFCYYKIFRVARGLQVQPMGEEQVRNWKAVRTIVLVVGCFFLCWTPSLVTFPFLQTISGFAPIISIMIFWLPISNSFMNCFIYIATDTRFRDGFVRLLHIR